MVKQTTTNPKPRGRAASLGATDGAAVNTLLRPAGGERSGDRPSDEWKEALADQAMEALWLEGLDPDDTEKQEKAVVAGLAGIAPQDELEGMMAVQLIAAHNASLAAYRRAMDVERSFNLWRDAITQANSLSRTFSTLLDALHRYRGSQQRITVEHVHRPQNGALDGGIRLRATARVIPAGEGVSGDSEEQPHAR